MAMAFVHMSILIVCLLLIGKSASLPDPQGKATTTTKAATTTTSATTTKAAKTTKATTTTSAKTTKAATTTEATATTTAKTTTTTTESTTVKTRQERCSKSRGFVPDPAHVVQMYFSHYRCDEAAFDDRERYHDNYAVPDTKSFTSPRTTLVFIGTPDISGSGYYEFNALPSHVPFSNNELLKNFDLLILDMPGIGYSHVADEKYFATMNVTLAADIAHAIKTIIERSEESKSRDFYLYAESWGTKLVPSVALKLYSKLTIELRERFQGIFIGSPFISPIDNSQVWAERLLHDGFVDVHQYEDLKMNIVRMQKEASKGNWKVATRLYKTVEGIVHDKTGGVDVCNLYHQPPCANDFAGRAINTDEMKELRSLVKCSSVNNRKIHAVKTSMENAMPGFNYRWNDQEQRTIKAIGANLLKPDNGDVLKVLEELDLNVIAVSGHNDLLSGPQSVFKWISTLGWTGHPDFANHSDHTTFSIAIHGKPEVRCYEKIGYKKRHGLLQVYTLFNFGHRLFDESVYIPILTRMFELAVKEEEGRYDNTMYYY